MRLSNELEPFIAGRLSSSKPLPGSVSLTDELFDEAPPKRPGAIHCRTSIVVKATLNKLQALGDIQGRAGDIRLENGSSMGCILAKVERGCGETTATNGSHPTMCRVKTCSPEVETLGCGSVKRFSAA